jgi:methyltransferase-like protein 6
MDTKDTAACAENNVSSGCHGNTELKYSNDVPEVTEVTQRLRQLTCEEREALEKDKRVVTEFKQRKFEAEAQKNWDLFYKRNTTKFFKDRHWTKREFSELAQTKVNIC